MFRSLEDDYIVPQHELRHLAWAIKQLIELSKFEFDEDTKGLKEVFIDFFEDCEVIKC